MHTITPSAPPRRILRQSTVVARVGVHATTIYRWERAELFPKRIVLGPNSVGWYADEVDAWFEARQRQGETGRPSPNPLATKRVGEEQPA
jgi:predicted DNA-binding transcriptional regulator AlpA